MNKILLIPFLMINLTFAEYIARVPLENQNGGSLPTNSIIIKNSTEDLYPEYEKTDYFGTITFSFNRVLSNATEYAFSNNNWLWGATGGSLDLNKTSPIDRIDFLLDSNGYVIDGGMHIRSTNMEEKIISLKINGIQIIGANDKPYDIYRYPINYPHTSAIIQWSNLNPSPLTTQIDSPLTIEIKTIKGNLVWNGDARCFIDHSKDLNTCI